MVDRKTTAKKNELHITQREEQEMNVRLVSDVHHGDLLDKAREVLYIL